MLKVRPDLWSYVLQGESSEEEHYVDVDNTSGSVTSGRSVSGYQPHSRNPLYCRAETSCLWELARLTFHYHPSVQAFSKKIASVSVNIVCSGVNVGLGTKFD